MSTYDLPGGAISDGVKPSERRGLTQMMEVLDEASLTYWVDSGVLLGLHRDGGLLSWEKDIDLGVTGEQVPALLACAESFEALGYVSVVNRYHGLVWSLALTPGPAMPESALRAAIHVFYPMGDHLWSPQPQIYVPPPAPDIYRGRRSSMGRLLKRAVDTWFYRRGVPADGRVSRAPDKTRSLPYRAARLVYRSLDGGVMAETWPIREVFVPMTWVIPTELILPLSSATYDGVEIPVPHRIEPYLQYRYGDWRTAVKDWCYWEDDGGIRHQRPTIVAADLRRGRDIAPQ